MLNRKINTEVIIIGGDHHNTLAVCRSFFYNRIPFKLLIHTKEKSGKIIRIGYSKSVEYMDIVQDDPKYICDWLLKNIDKTHKIFLFPCSDLAAYTIDLNYKKLEKYYVFPCFRDKPNMIVKLMDKYNQKKWAEENEIPMAKTWNINVNIPDVEIIEKMIFPCILKPKISAYGEKNDIKICNNIDELYKAISSFKEKKYENVILQQFLKKEYEVCSYGCILDNNIIKCSVKKIREYPPNGGGSLAFACFYENDSINKILNNILLKLKNEGYRGFFDIEFLICKDKIYLNEINFRHSGNGYALIKNGVDAPFIWYKYLNYKEKINYRYKNNFFFMDETNELKLLKTKSINITTFIKDIIKSKAFARFDIRDLNVLFAYIKIKLFRRKNEDA